MASHLLIVESPSKAKTLKKYLGKDFEILASYGHVRDLVPKTGAVDPDDDFRMKYEIIDRNAKHVDAIAKAVKNADTILLATDPDREGEAIAWHLSEILKAKRALKDKKLKRVVFYEITEGAVKDAVKNPRDISMELVNAQQARRALDYLVGFNLSPLLWKKIRRGLSAGRVQSPALRLIVEREIEIENFKTREYWSIHFDCREGEDALHRQAHALPGREARPVLRRQRRAERGDHRLPRVARQGRGARHRDREEAQAALARPALHHLHAAAGGRAQARLLHRPRDEGGAEPLRRRVPRQGGHGPHHLHAHRLREPVEGSAHGDPRLHHEELRRRLPAEVADRLQEHRQERAGGPRGHPADLDRAHAGIGGAVPERRAAQALRDDLEARALLPDDARQVRHGGRRLHRRRAGKHLPRHRPDDGLPRLLRRLPRGPGRRGRGGGQAPARCSRRATSFPSSSSTASSTSPSRRRATPRRAW